MKKSLQCCKCDGRKIAHIARMRLPERAPGLFTTFLTLPLVMRHRMLGAPDPRGGFETFICRGCAFTEWYAIDHEKLDPALDPDVRILDNEPKATLR